MAQKSSVAGILPLYHGRQGVRLTKRARDRRILFIILAIFSFTCFIWLFLIPDSKNEPQRSLEQVYSRFAPHLHNGNLPDRNLVRPPVPQPPQFIKDNLPDVVPRPKVPFDQQLPQINIPEDKGLIKPKVPDGIAHLKPEVPDDRVQIKPKVPNDKDQINPKVPGDSDQIKPKVPDEKDQIKPKVPDDRDQIKPKVPDDRDQIKPKVPDDRDQIKPKVPDGQQIKPEERVDIKKKSPLPKLNQQIPDPGEINIDNLEPNSIEYKRVFVRNMMKLAWGGYKSYAWGNNELKPISNTAHNPPILGRAGNLGLTLVDSLDTLWIMGMEDDLKDATEWVRQSLNLKVASDLSLFEVNIRYLGGLISIYLLTDDEIFLTKAVEIADLLLPAFNSPSGLPYAIINPTTGLSKPWGWAGGNSILAEVGTLHLEFMYLSVITQNPIYYQKVLNVRKVLKEMPKHDGLYPNYINPNSKTWGQSHVSLGALGDSFYEYLIKTYLISNYEDKEALGMYFETMEAIRERLVVKSPGGFTYVGDYRNGRVEPKMDHLACFSGGLFGISAKHAPPGREDVYMEIADGLTTTCHEAYDRADTKLGPEAFRFEGNEVTSARPNEKVYLLRPETVESYFVMWRLTGNEKYRNWAWEATLAIEEHTKCTSGYSGIRNVYQVPTQKDDVQQSFFLAETLKYLYLIFCDNDFFGLDNWIFNTEAHPLPVLPGMDMLPLIE